MNTKRLIIAWIVLLLLLSACAPAAAPTSAPAAPASPASQADPSARPQQPTQHQYPTASAAARLPATSQPAATQIAAAPAQRPLPTMAAARPVPPRPEVGMPAPQDNTFQDVGVNPIVDAREEHLSTFGLDVDTGAYTIARRYVMDGNLPPFAAIRAEEFINYFKPGFANPADVGFAVYADGAPAPFQMGGQYVLRFGVQGYAVPEELRKPAALTFVIDSSGSMDMENRLELVKRSLELLIARLRPDDSVTIVSFGSDAWVVLQPTSGADKKTIRRAVDSLRPGGSTNAERGLELGYQLALQAFKPGGINRVILCSDGVANTGLTRPEDILNRIHAYISEGVTLTTAGFGMGNLNDALMEQMADKGDGQYFYLDNLEEAQKVFVEKITGTLQTIAKDAKVQVDFNADVVARYRLVGYENRGMANQDFRNDNVDAGELGAGHSATALYVVDLKPNAAGRIATVQLRWQNPDSSEVREINGNFNTWDMAGSFEESDPRYQLSVTVAQYAEILRESPHTGHMALGELCRYAYQVARKLPDDPDVVEFSQLVERAAHLQNRAED